MPQSGVRFGKYQLLDRIAAGGMAEIYRALQSGAAGITKSVVIKKILPLHASNRAFISMFINEAKIAMGLSHGNIAQVFDFGEIDGEYFLAMEYVHGQPLSNVVKRAREMRVPVIPAPFAVLVVMELCKGLHYAHTRLDDEGRPLNIIHRDVSPQNVIVGYEGQVKIVDFGIAKARTAGQSETVTGAVKGKYVYFSPEQARGKELDSRTDTFAAGVVLYELLCGRLPAEGKMMKVLSQIGRGDFPTPRALNPDLPPGLERILLTALALEKEDRYPSAQAFQEALATYLYAHTPIFSASSLSQLMAFLFEPELAAEGRGVELPPEFLEQVPRWRKKLPAPRPPTSRQPAPAPEEDTRTEGSTTRQGLRSRRLLFIGAPLLAGALAAGLGLLAVRRASFTDRLEPDRSPSRQPVALPEPLGPKTPATRPADEVAMVARFPVSSVRLVAKRHVLTVPGSRAARIRLDPRKRYRIWTEGKLSLGASHFNQAIYFLEGPDRLAAPDRFGLVAPAPRLIKNASALYAFVLGDSTGGSSGGLKLRIRERGSAAAFTLPVDARKQAIVLDDSERFLLTHLDPLAGYELKVTQAPDPARTHEGQGGRVGKVVYSQSAGLTGLERQEWANETQRVLEVGRAYRMSGAAWMSFTFPDDDLADNSGALQVEIARLPPESDWAGAEAGGSTR